VSEGPEADAIAILCGWDGAIADVLYNRLKLNAGIARGSPVSSVVDEASREKCSRFLDTIRRRRAAFEWQMNVAHDSDAVPVYFSGAAIDGQLLIIGMAPSPANWQARDELLRIQKEQLSAVRAGLQEHALRSLGHAVAPRATGVDRSGNTTLTQYLASFGADLSESRRRSEEMARARAIAESASRTKSMFIAHIGHELKTPLNSVIGFADLLLRNKAKSLRERDLQYLERISANAHQLLRIINSILDLARLDAGRVQLQFGPVSVPALIRDTVSQLWSGDGGSAVEVAIDIPEPVADIVTDGDKLRQILINLMANALKFTERGTVSIALNVDAQSRLPVRIDVRDTGIGIPADRLDTVFDMFEQADPATGRRYGGAGLGLAISRSLCDLLGYRLSVQSEVGRGSTFSVLLSTGQTEPRAAHPATANESA
jgi:signal transduction histidine kinase